MGQLARQLAEARLLARIKELEGALRPFAELANQVINSRVAVKDDSVSVVRFDSDDSSWNYGSIALGDFLQAARAVLSPPESHDDVEGIPV